MPVKVSCIIILFVVVGRLILFVLASLQCDQLSLRDHWEFKAM